VSGPYLERSHSPLRRRPDAATWPTARDVSQWVEPDVRPLGRAVSAFIVEKTRRLSIPLTGDVPLQPLMRPAAPLTDGDQTIPQAACLSTPGVGNVTILLLSHPVLEGKPNANYVRARIRTHVHSDYINEHHRTMLE
jgi:hypothetical protein